MCISQQLKKEDVEAYLKVCTPLMRQWLTDNLASLYPALFFDIESLTDLTNFEEAYVKLPPAQQKEHSKKYLQLLREGGDNKIVYRLYFHDGSHVETLVEELEKPGTILSLAVDEALTCWKLLHGK